MCQLANIGTGYMDRCGVETRNFKTRTPQSTTIKPIRMQYVIIAVVGESACLAAVGTSIWLIIRKMWLDRREVSSQPSHCSTPTIAADVHLVARRLGKGGFGDVELGTMSGKSVAVKICRFSDTDSWCRESKFYETAKLQPHENISKFYKSGKTSREGLQEFWIVIKFYSNGSLFSYLQNNEITPMQLVSFARGIASGVAFLHSEMVSVIVAHRDVKSQNILISNDNTCVIADFGLAAIYDKQTQLLDATLNTETGTIRYMSPEILNISIELDIRGFMKADVYAFGIVFWELTQRTTWKTNSNLQEYVLPFYEFVGRNPTKDEMKRVVCEEGRRPALFDGNEHDFAKLSNEVITDCWNGDTSKRPSAGQLKTNLFNKWN